MPSITETFQLIESKEFQRALESLYGDVPSIIINQKQRYKALVQEYVNKYSEGDVFLFSSPGRSEISGNHTDHNLGKVIAASINMDCIGAAAKNDQNIIRIKSITYNEDFIIDLNSSGNSLNLSGTYTLVKGILDGFERYGYKLGGFDVCITSDVISAAGVSSSASFEMLICSIINFFYNNNEMDVVTCAKIGQYAENSEWNKQSGLLDQIACGYGGLISIDFKNIEAPLITTLNFSSIDKDYELFIVPTGANHADLSEEYSSIPTEMKAVARELGKNVLRELEKQDILDNLDKLRESVGDRAVLRALHFYEENIRVDQQVEALTGDNANSFIKLVNESGNSSWKWLQNCYSNTTPSTQGVTLYLALTELFIKEKGAGACRVHGGGFAGVIMTLLPKEYTDSYKAHMHSFGVEQIYPVRIRKHGAININLL